MASSTWISHPVRPIKCSFRHALHAGIEGIRVWDLRNYRNILQSVVDHVFQRADTRKWNPLGIRPAYALNAQRPDEARAINPDRVQLPDLRRNYSLATLHGIISCSVEIA